MIIPYHFYYGTPIAHEKTSHYRSEGSRSKETHYVLQCFSYSPWKSKVLVKAIFAYFYKFCHAWKIVSTGTFFGFFLFSSRVHKSVSRAEFIKKVIIFAGKIAQYFSQAPILFFMDGTWLNSSRTRFSFHGYCLCKNLVFHGRILFFHAKKKKKNSACWHRTASASDETPKSSIFTSDCVTLRLKGGFSTLTNWCHSYYCPTNCNLNN